MRPNHRSSQFTGGARTNDSRMASAMGTSTACAQYRTTITSTPPANVIHGFSEFDASSIHFDSNAQGPAGLFTIAQRPPIECATYLSLMRKPVIVRLLGSAARAWWDDDCTRL